MSDHENLPIDIVGRDENGKTEVTPPNDGQSKGPPRKRRRVVISCFDCHKRKQKCDRKMPCTNCVSRGKESSCRYETGTPLVKGQRKRSPREEHPSEPADSIPIKAADFGYSSTGASTLGFLKKIEGASIGGPLSSVGVRDETDNFGSRERYKSLVRHLPARTFVEILVQTYLREFNWMYYGVDEITFQDNLEQWYSLPFHILSSAGPQAIEPELRAFPALLFQILATALLAVPDEEDETLASLKYAGSMTFEDLAIEYSETGVALLTLLGKRQMTITTVLAGWVRAAFLKYTGQVTEAWHQVGTAIRDAQEIGLHREQFDPQPGLGDSTEDALQMMWSAQCRRRIWMTLVGWDLHTGAVLGRPTSVDFRTLKRSLPVDIPFPIEKRKTPVISRGENDPPTPLTRALWAYEVMRPLRDILDLEKEGPFPKDFSKVEKLHQELVDLRDQTPAEFRLENPDTRFDHLPECWWLTHVRSTLPQLASFNFMALHRPYIFTRASSRYEALKASLDMLEAQRIHFRTLGPRQYKTFSLFFGTFDAIVMMASIYILFPRENPELLSSASQHFVWGVERFETMADHNRLAGAALGVLNAIYIRLKKAVGYGFLSKACPRSFTCEEFQPEAGESNTGVATNISDMQTPASDLQSAHHPSVTSASGSSIAQPNDAETNPTPTTSTGLTPGASTAELFTTPPSWSFPLDFDFSSLPPMYPTGDLAYNDLTGIRDDGLMATSTNMWPNAGGITDSTTAGYTSGTGAGGAAVAGRDQEVPWAFGGDFGNDTIWNLLNQLPPN